MNCGVGEGWVVEIDPAEFEKLNQQERFWQLVALARAVNALRFVHTALLRHEGQENSLDARRTSFNSFFFNCALLFEALLLVSRPGDFVNANPLLRIGISPAERFC
jgi:hypothetical protein